MARHTYAKIYDSIFESTLHGDWRALVTFMALLVLKNRDGEVDMTRRAISTRTGIPIDIIEKGIETLESPDPDSRSAEYDGRRIIRLEEHRDFGWLIVNHEKYRSFEDNRRNYQRDKQREYDAQKNELFDKFWEAYPNKKNKARARTAFKKVYKKFDEIMDGLERAKASEQWSKDNGKFIPHPASWINGERWLDEHTDLYDPAKGAI